jgi:hypothetical protein
VWVAAFMAAALVGGSMAAAVAVTAAADIADAAAA